MTLFTSRKLLYPLFSLFFVMALGIACQDNEKGTMKDSQQTISNPSAQPTTVNPPGQQTSPAASAPQGQTGITHYICENNCAGSGSSGAGNCPICGNTYVHNDGYHSIDQDIQKMQQGGQIQQTSPGNLPPSVFNTPQNQQQTLRSQPQAPPTPAQNSAGVFHYTCSNGCAGGSGSAAACASCGTTLVHNQGYH